MAFLLNVFVICLAFGGVAFSLNTLLVRTAIRQRAHRLSLANDGYGVGSVVVPVLIILIRPHNFPFLFAGLGGLAVFLSLFNRGIRAPPLHHAVRRCERATMKSQRRPILITFIVAYILYVAAESRSAGWITSPAAPRWLLAVDRQSGDRQLLGGWRSVASWVDPFADVFRTGSWFSAGWASGSCCVSAPSPTPSRRTRIPCWDS